MPSISARAASSSTTRTRPREVPFWTALGGTATILRCSGSETGYPPGRGAPRGEHRRGRRSRTRAPRGPCEIADLDRSVAVVVARVRALDRDADVVGLHLAQLGELHAEGVEVKPRDLLVEQLGQDRDGGRLALVGGPVGPQLDLGEHLVGER